MNQTETEKQSADTFADIFTDGNKWERARALIATTKTGVVLMVGFGRGKIHLPLLLISCVDALSW